MILACTSSVSRRSCSVMSWEYAARAYTSPESSTTG